jgi:outer membrane protein OmpA-like peptidoglycan-associated protein
MNYFFLLFAFAFSTMLKAQLQPTETQSLMNLIITDFKGKPHPGETLVFKAQKSGKSYTVTTGKDGKAQILLPEGDTYDVSYRDFIEQVNYSKVEIPLEPGMYTYDLQIKYEPEKVFNLENVHFDIAKATLKPESYKALNELVELLKAKPSMTIEIAGHTDSDGDDDTNMKLSQERAASVVKYLISKGISSTRLTAKGYGETQPVASNDSEEGKKKNRRTEVRIISE